MRIGAIKYKAGVVAQSPVSAPVPPPSRNTGATVGAVSVSSVTLGGQPVTISSQPVFL